MLGSVDVEAGVQDADYVFEGRLTLRLCNEVRSSANNSLQMMALTARQLYRQHRALLAGRPLLITPRSLVELSRESARGLTAAETETGAVQIERSTTGSGYTPTLPSPQRAAVEPCAVPPDVLEACRAAESAHHSLMAAAYGAKRAAQLESYWRALNIGSSVQCCEENPCCVGLYGEMPCRQAHRWPPAALGADQKHIFDEIWGALS